MSLDLVYFSGGPRLRVLEAIVAAKHCITHVYVNDPDRWPKVRPTIEKAKDLGLPISVVRRKSELEELGRQLRGQLCFSAGFAYLFPPAFLESVGQCLNVHGSLLPKYPGARTLSWAIEAGERESGVTVHQVDAGMDTGPILLQKAFPLSPFETTQSLARKTAAFETQVVVEALERFEQLGAAAFQSQPNMPAELLPNRIPEHSQLDPSKTVLELFNKIRAANADLYPAYFYLHGEKVCLKAWRPEKPEDEADLI